MFRGRKSYNLKNDNVRETTTFQYAPKGSSDVNLNAECIKESQERRNVLKSFEGLLYSVLGSFLLSLMFVYSKKLAYISLGEQSFIYNLGNVVFNFPVLFCFVRETFKTSRQDAFILIFRAVFVALALYTRLIAFRNLPLAEAAIVMSTDPAMTSVGAYFFLKEPCSYAQLVALFITLIGMLTSMRVPELLKNRSTVKFNSNYILGLGSGVLSVFIMAFVHVSLRKMKNVHSSVIILYSGCTGMVVNAIITGTFESFSFPQCGRDTLELALMGIIGYFANMCLILAFQKEIASVVAVIRCAIDIIAGMIFQKIFFNQVPDAYVSVGAVLVIASISVISIRSWLVSLPDTAPIRKKLRYLWI